MAKGKMNSVQLFREVLASCSEASTSLAEARNRLTPEDLEEARLSLGLGLREFARETGIAPAYLSRMETGQQAPSVEVIKRILARLEQG